MCRCGRGQEHFKLMYQGVSSWNQKFPLSEKKIALMIISRCVLINPSQDKDMQPFSTARGSALWLFRGSKQLIRHNHSLLWSLKPYPLLTIYLIWGRISILGVAVIALREFILRLRWTSKSAKPTQARTTKPPPNLPEPYSGSRTRTIHILDKKTSTHEQIGLHEYSPDITLALWIRSSHRMTRASTDSTRSLWLL